MGVSTKALKARIRSVDSTMHITKAMELVASSKMKRARARMDGSRFYRTVLAEAFADLAASDTPYSAVREDLPALWIVIAGDRGLAGGYNGNIFKLTAGALREGDIILPIGLRAAEYYARRGYRMFDDGVYSAETVTTADCAAIAGQIKARFDAGEIGAVYAVSTAFVSMLAQEAGVQKLLPLEKPEKPTEENTAARVSILYEPDAETVLSAIIPEYIAGTLYSAAAESFAAELAARRTAMDTATKNAAEMIDTLNLRYNRARQSAITQEITEIVAGANA